MSKIAPVETCKSNSSFPKNEQSNQVSKYGSQYDKLMSLASGFEF